MPKYMAPKDTINYTNSITIDVRTDEEVELISKVTHAIHIPMNSFLDKVNPESDNFHPDLALDKHIFIYCEAGGEKAVKACEVLEEQFGYLNTYYTGGIVQWYSAGFVI